MNSLRASLASIPGAINNLIAENHHILYMSQNFSASSSLSGDEGSEQSQAIPNSLIKEQWQLILASDASIPDLKEARERCTELVMNSEECSVERKWLVRHLVELRFRITELEDADRDPDDEGRKVILGHHFTMRHNQSRPTKQYCDHCTGIIWSVVQASYVCTDCGFIVHHKCVGSVIRICAHVLTSEKKYPIDEICPEIGLAAQAYKCAECRTPLEFKRSWMEPRLCDYSGLYYCPSCHWNNISLIPARVVHNWDFTSRKVSRPSLQQINLLLDKPLIKLEEANPKLFVFLQKLSIVKKVRENLSFMRKYLSECRIACEKKILENQIGTKRYLVQSPDYYSITDLIQIESGLLIEFLNKIFDVLNKHIRNCEVCSGKGYICEICKNVEVIYPFDDGCIPCDKCLTIYHRVCWTRKMMTCPRCIRIDERKSQKETISLEENDGI